MIVWTGLMYGLVEASLLGCPIVLPPHFGMMKNFFFAGANKHVGCEVTRPGVFKKGYLYCHEARYHHDSQFSPNVTAQEYIDSLRCYPMAKDPWLVLCNISRACVTATDPLLYGDDSKEEIRLLNLGARGWHRAAELMYSHEHSHSDVKTAVESVRRDAALGFWAQFFGSRWPECGFAKHSLNVVAHVRRGDLLHDGGMWTAIGRSIKMSYYLKIMVEITSALQKAHPRVAVRLFVHSEADTTPKIGRHTPGVRLGFAGIVFTGRMATDGSGMYEAFFSDPGVESGSRRVFFSLNQHPMTTLYCLSRSDVLLNAWSYFSHVATFLSEGVQILPNTMGSRAIVYMNELCRLVDCSQEGRAIRASYLLSSGVDTRSIILDRLHKHLGNKLM